MITLLEDTIATMQCFLGVYQPTVIKIPAGTELIFVKGSGGGYAVARPIIFGSPPVDIQHRYAYLPDKFNRIYHSQLVDADKNCWIISLCGQEFKVFSRKDPTYDEFMESILSYHHVLFTLFEDFAEDKDSISQKRQYDEMCDEIRRLYKTGIDINSEMERLNGLPSNFC